MAKGVVEEDVLIRQMGYRYVGVGLPIRLFRRAPNEAGVFSCGVLSAEGSLLVVEERCLFGEHVAWHRKRRVRNDFRFLG